MNKIVAISLIADSADIIESFVRHTLTYADEMLVVDHKSSDGTWGILEALVQEGLPLLLERYEPTELCHEEIMTQLMHRAIKEYGADIVVPVDADEFLVTEDAAKPCRAVLLRLRTDTTFFAWHWMYELQEPEKAVTDFLLIRPLRRKKQHEAVQKAIIGRDVIEDYPLLAQGTHYLYRLENGRRVSAPALEISFLHFAHFQWRGPLHTAVKALNGWIGNAAKYSLHTMRCYYWKEHFDAVFRGETPAVALASEECETVRQLALTDREIRLLYTKGGAFSPQQRLMLLAAQLAGDFAQERVLARRKCVSVILPYMGEAASWQKALASVVQQTYPYIEILVLDMVGAAEWLGQAMAALPLPHSIVEARTSGWGEKLARAALGEYVQWVLPGDVLLPEKIMLMVTALELDPELDLALSDSVNTVTDEGVASETLPEYAFRMQQAHCIVASGTWHANFILSTGTTPEGGLSSVLSHRSVFERCDWLETAFFRGRVFSLAAFFLLFRGRPNVQVDVFELPLLRLEREIDREDILWRLLEWAALLGAEAEAFGMEGILQARKLLEERRTVLFAEPELRLLAHVPRLETVLDELLQLLPESRESL